MTGTGSAGGDDHAYFRAIEETFIRLRGTPFLLSPSDWQVARRWRRRGIPLEVVRRGLERFFEGRRERGVEEKIQSLRYCAPAVERHWSEVRDLAAPGRRGAPRSLEVADRLARLAAAVPDDLHGASRLRSEITSLADDPGRSAEAVEEALVELERELVDGVEASLPEEERAHLAARVESSLAAVAERLPEEVLTESRRRLLRDALRRRIGLPVLSLFAPEARER